jgi:hypothetical protein
MVQELFPGTLKLLFGSQAGALSFPETFFFLLLAADELKSGKNESQ